MPTYAYFFLSLAILIGGYAIYGRLVERLFKPNYLRPTPAVTMYDGVDYVKLPTWKLFLIQLLNIAGVGPVFGPILGALYGPSALLWIVFGTLLAGGVHDYFSGMLSLRYDGKSIADVVGYTLGNGFKQFMRGFSLVLLVLVGVVFVTAPAGILNGLTSEKWPLINTGFWLAVIFGYYFLATILPIDVIIARIYPLFAAVLLIMAFGVAGGMIVKGYVFYDWPEITQGATVLSNVHPKGLPMWPLMFITIACGALSGFHATQSPLMSRCCPNENNGRLVFYGAMVAEGVIAMVWATAGMTFYESPAALQAVIDQGGAGLVVQKISLSVLGGVGGILAILGVVILPISSGDTAFRAARLLVSDFTGVSQKKALSRLAIAVPLFAIGIVLSQIKFEIVWRYFGWANQTLATLVLWAAAAYMVRRGGFYWLVAIPALFMTATTVAYIMGAKEGFRIPWELSTWIGFGAAAVSLVWFVLSRDKFREKILLELPVHRDCAPGERPQLP
ncbi:MAG: carbon starvation protein A [Deltaproteobacteria bacterium]|jgi:carbon starvation protein CstA|nr:carbon starvation protein A [Deltaproteobacteria bacterium]